jgi:hypothetical protein
MSTKTKAIIGIIVAIFVVIAGCKMALRSIGQNIAEKMIEDASGGKANMDVQNGSMTITTSEGTVTTGSGKVPESWPKDVPVYAGATVQFSGTNNAGTGQGGMALVLSSKEDPEVIVEYYKTTLKAGGWTVVNTMAAQGNTILLFTKGSKALSLSITGASGETSITMGVQDQAR